jgi:hypothetical protein
MKGYIILVIVILSLASCKYSDGEDDEYTYEETTYEISYCTQEMQNVRDRYGMPNDTTSYFSDGYNSKTYYYDDFNMSKTFEWGEYVDGCDVSTHYY